MGQAKLSLPVLEALLGRLGREPGGEQLIALLRQYAPSWLVQLPALLNDAELDGLQRKMQGATRERMLREMAEMLEALTAEQPLVLVLEDLHWCDYSTLDLLSAVAQRREAARLLLIGTYRPAEIIVSGHPLKAVKQELHMHGQCEELPLGFLTADEGMHYLTARFLRHQFPTALGRILHHRTDGNPLFLVNVVDSLVIQQLVSEQDGQWQLQVPLEHITIDVPTSVQQMIEKQLERLALEEQRVLEVASVAGDTFSTAAVAAGLETESEHVEEWCEGLARRKQFLEAQELETWPDGTATGHYRFLHAHYRQVVYERVGAARRVRLHRQIGDREETGYVEQAGTRAAALAVHFEQGQDYPRAVQYLERAAQNALQLSAYTEAMHHLSKALKLLKLLPDTPERTQQELRLQMFLGPALMAAKGYATPEVAEVQVRVQELCQQVGETPELFRALPQVRGFYFVRGELQTARTLAEQYLALAQRFPVPVLLVWASYGLGETLLFSGEIAAARVQLEQGIAAYDPQQVRAFFVRTVQDPGMAAYRAMGMELYRPQSLILLADAYAPAGQGEEGLKVLAEASEIIHRTGAWLFEAEVYRLKGELTLQSKQVQNKSEASRNKHKVTTPHSLTLNPYAEAEAEACFHKAIDIAYHQQAKSLELRAVMSLSRLW